MHLDVTSDINRNTYLLTNKFCSRYCVVAADSSLVGCDAYQASRSEQLVLHNIAEGQRPCCPCLSHGPRCR